MFQRRFDVGAGPVVMKWVPTLKYPSFLRRNSVARDQLNSLMASQVRSHLPDKTFKLIDPKKGRVLDRFTGQALGGAAINLWESLWVGVDLALIASF